MCNITYLPAGIPVPTDEIANAASWNQDGHGWGIAAKTGLLLTGRYLDFDQAIATFEATRAAFPDSPAMFHSRYATHGTIDESNVHPFEVGKYAAVAHNGILPSKFHPVKGRETEAMSDTQIMARYWLAGRAQTAGVWTRKERRRIARIIGKGNKLCILSVSPYLPEPRGYLVNASAGHWDSLTGAWFSSSDYTCAWSATKRGTRFGYWSGGWNWDDDYAAIGTKASRNLTDAGETCPNCRTNEDLDIAARMCLMCDFCLDCLLPMAECSCWYGTSKSNRASHDYESCTETHCADCSAQVFEEANRLIQAELAGDE